MLSWGLKRNEINLLSFGLDEKRQKATASMNYKWQEFSLQRFSLKTHHLDHSVVGYMVSTIKTLAQHRCLWLTRQITLLHPTQTHMQVQYIIHFKVTTSKTARHLDTQIQYDIIQYNIKQTPRQTFFLCTNNVWFIESSMYNKTTRK